VDVLKEIVKVDVFYLEPASLSASSSMPVILHPSFTELL
jgi:hypothetical protein